MKRMKSFVEGKAIWTLLLLVATSWLAVDSKNIKAKKQNDTTKLDLSQAEQILEEPLMTFGSNLFKQVREAKKNVIFSPMSVHSALNLVLLGTKTDSETEKELVQALGYSKLNGTIGKVHESYAKLLSKFREFSAGRKSYGVLSEEDQTGELPPRVDFWTAALKKGPHEPLPEYLDHIKRYYNSSVYPVSTDMKENDELLDTVNSWAKQAGFKSDVLTPEDLAKNFSMLLMSAVQVESNWEEEFDEEEVDEIFYNYGKEDELVEKGKALVNDMVYVKFASFNMMSSRNSHSSHIMKKHPKLYEELAPLEFRYIEIPMKSGLSYTIIEPFDAAEGKGLAKLEKALLKHSRLCKLLQIMDGEGKRKYNRLQMPQFKFENNFDLKGHLQSIGVHKIFKQKNSGITEMFPVEHYVSEANHKAVIEVDKNGLKAGALTSIQLAFLSKGNPMNIVVNKPYMFLVRYNKLPLFMGHLVQV